MIKAIGYCFVSISPVRKEATDKSEMVSQLLFGELIEIRDIREPWAEIKTEDGYTGYIDYKHIKTLTETEVRRWKEERAVITERESRMVSPWGLQHVCRGSFIGARGRDFCIGADQFHAEPDGQPSYSSVYKLAYDYLNTPYLWGGKSPFGIDCSGFTQIVFRVFGYELPRDAYQQAEHGLPKDYNDAAEGDLAFFSNTDGRIIHVGIMGPGKLIIHASGHVRVDRLTSEGIYREDMNRVTHSLTCIRRVIN